MNRREFIGGAACAGTLAAAEGCRSFFGKTSFYGSTIRDRLWMWGHHPGAVKIAHWGFDRCGYEQKGHFADQAEACRLMGIPNNCVIRCTGLPLYPWGDYFEQFRSLKRFAFGIGDGGKETMEEKMRIAFYELKPNFPNFTGCFLDDFFSNKKLNRPYDQLIKIADEVHEHDLRLQVVLYADDDGFKPEFRPSIGLCDETTLWFWRQDNIKGMYDDVRRCRDFIGPEKDLLLGLYMWDFSGNGRPISGALMEKQLGFAKRLLSSRTITGLIFHPTFVADLNLDSVRVSKEWISAYGDGEWGV